MQTSWTWFLCVYTKLYYNILYYYYVTRMLGSWDYDLKPVLEDADAFTCW